MAEPPNTAPSKRYPPSIGRDSSGRPQRFPYVSRSFFPSVFTVMNMVSGYASIVMSGEGSYIAASWLIILAAFFDTIDGFVARVTNGTSDFGFELDSLSDLVSFGAAPAYLAYTYGLESIPGMLGLALSSLLMVGSGLRLARFNISMIGYSKDSFSGLPTPAQALAIAGFVLWMQSERYFPVEMMPTVLGWLSVLLALLMVSKVNYDTLPKPTLESFRRRPLQMSLYAVAAFSVLLFQARAFFLAMLLYILLGVVRSLVLFVRQRAA